MTILYPALARSIATGSWSPVDSGNDKTEETLPDPAGELGRILAWWRGGHLDDRRTYDDRIWPRGFHPGAVSRGEAAEDRVGWFTFFALGIFRTLPWNNEGAHKSFIEGAMREGWWQEMAEARFPKNALSEAELIKAAMPWLKRLDGFARPDVSSIVFPQWQRALADLYALARWLPDYAEAFQLLPRVVEREGPVLLKDIWRLSYAPVWQRRGLEGAPLTQSLGLGANWMIREAIRHGFWQKGRARCGQPLMITPVMGPQANVVRARLIAARTGAPEDFEHQIGWVLTAFQNAFYWLMRGAPLAEAVIATVARGGDTDTNGAICGALLGAAQGRDAIPLQWRNAVLTCRPVHAAGIRRSRPQTYWPDDALDLAEALLTADA